MSSMTFLVFPFVLRLLVALAFIAMGVTHFVPSVQATMSAMIPPRLHFRGALRPRNLVIVTGICEIVGGAGLLWPPTRVAAGIALIVFLVAVFPANAYAARHPKRFGRVAMPLVPRLIGQLVLMALILLVVVWF